MYTAVSADVLTGRVTAARNAARSPTREWYLQAAGGSWLVALGWSPDKDGATEPLAVEKGGTTEPLAVEGPWVGGDRWRGRRVVVVEVLPVARDRLDADKEAAELVVVELQHVGWLVGCAA
jgi:hypothetical protein